jgi:hypothetical protein
MRQRDDGALAIGKNGKPSHDEIYSNESAGREVTQIT